MTTKRMIELLEIEHECMLRGAHDDCDRNCADCELVQDDNDLHEMYTDVISILKEYASIQSLSDDFLKYMVLKAYDYSSEMIDANWDLESNRLPSDKEYELKNISLFALRMKKELHERGQDSE